MQLPKKIVEFIENLDDRMRYAIFAGVLLLAFLLDYFLLMKPQISALMKITPEINILNGNIKKTKKDIRQIDEYKKDVDALEKQLAEINYRLRSKQEVPLILEEITLKANENGIQIDQIMPYPQEQKELLRNLKIKFFSLPILLDARAKYHNIGRFINQIENETDFTFIETFSISQGENAREHRFKLTLEVIVDAELTEAEKAEAKKKAQEAKKKKKKKKKKKVKK